MYVYVCVYEKNIGTLNVETIGDTMDVHHYAALWLSPLIEGLKDPTVQIFYVTNCVLFCVQITGLIYNTHTYICIYVRIKRERGFKGVRDLLICMPGAWIQGLYNVYSNHDLYCQFQRDRIIQLGKYLWLTCLLIVDNCRFSCLEIS